jgi:(2Fe-2S) ferredoxin
MKPYYRRHVFFCTNLRAGGQRTCCAQAGASGLRDWAKARVKALGLSGAGGVRINSAGCMDRCEVGPTVVIYPEGVWYSYANEDDLEEIIQSHLIEGQIVDRLRI